MRVAALPALRYLACDDPDTGICGQHPSAENLIRTRNAFAVNGSPTRAGMTRSDGPARPRPPAAYSGAGGAEHREKTQDTGGHDLVSARQEAICLGARAVLRPWGKGLNQRVAVSGTPVLAWVWLGRVP